jgi:ABC-type nickel/cobalt efflux system permease component RcnA
MFAAIVGLCWSVVLVGFLAALAHAFDATAAILAGAFLLGPTCVLAERSEAWFRRMRRSRPPAAMRLPGRLRLPGRER